MEVKKKILGICFFWIIDEKLEERNDIGWLKIYILG